MKRTVLNAGPGGLSDYYAWFEGSSHGAVLVYHVGDLAFDRDTENFTLHEGQREDAQALDALSKRVMRDADDGYLALTQKRLGHGIYEYRAVRIQADVTGSDGPYADAVRA